MARDTIQVSGLKELEQGLREVAPLVKLKLDHELKEIAEVVERDARARFGKYSAKSAAGFRSRVRQGSAVVEQRLRKTTGNRPDFGALQMTKALLPALDAHEQELLERTEVAVKEAIREVGL